MRLHHFHSSSTSFRVRIGLNLKGVAYESAPVKLDWKDGDHDKPAYREFNPQGNVPVLVDGDTKVFQSIAILEYLDEKHPTPPLLPQGAAGRAWVRAIALNVSCEIQAPNNLRVQRQLAQAFGADQAALSRWQLHWIQVGFDAVEAQLAASPARGKFCYGDAPTIADCCLIPQIYNARRPVVGADISAWPNIQLVWDACLALPGLRARAAHKPAGLREPDGPLIGRRQPQPRRRADVFCAASHSSRRPRRVTQRSM